MGELLRSRISFLFAATMRCARTNTSRGRQKKAELRSSAPGHPHAGPRQTSTTTRRPCPATLPVRPASTCFVAAPCALAAQGVRLFQSYPDPGSRRSYGIRHRRLMFALCIFGKLLSPFVTHLRHHFRAQMFEILTCMVRKARKMRREDVPAGSADQPPAEELLANALFLHRHMPQDGLPARCQTARQPARN